jgi:aminoglycoside phosphotransferase (APT) family kinase protein
MTEVEELIRHDLAAQLKEPVREVRAIPEGHSGFTYWVELDGRRAVLRLPPPGARIAGPADIPRQGRIMAALHAEGIPVPAVLAMSEDPVVGARPFVLMEAVSAERIEENLAGGVNPIQIAQSAIEVLRRIQAVPLEKTGIGSEDPMPAEGELARWAWLMERAPADLTTRAPLLAEVLAARKPLLKPPVLVHGDYHYGNMLFRDGRVMAVVDWEIAQIGQPLLDLGCICVAAQAGSPDEERGPAGRWDVSAEGVAEIYGADPADFRWYLGLTYYKYSAIFGYNLMLHRRGKRPDPSYERRIGAIVGFIEKGINLLG